MVTQINRGQLKKQVSYLIAICRLTVLFTLFLFYQLTWLTPHELNIFLYLFLPISILYLVFLTKYISFRRRYFYPGNTIKKSDLLWSCIPLAALHVLEILFIVFKDKINSQDNDAVYCWIAIAECGLAAYAGFYLSDLFVSVNNHKEPTAEVDGNLPTLLK